jgi:di/tricarboxylate transporter
MALVFTVLAITLALFALDKLRMDAVAVAALLALTLGGALTPEEALAGFANPIVIMIGALFVVGAGLVESGAADAAGRRLARVAGTAPLRLLLVLMAATGVLSSLLSSTGTVAVMLPIAVQLARKAGMTPRQILLPMAFAASIGGMLTLIGTPPNLAAHEALVAAGRPGFSFFSFTPIGLAMLAVGMGTVALFRSRLSGGQTAPEPDRAPGLPEMLAEYGLPESLFRAQIPEGSPWAGRSLADLALRTERQINVVAVSHGPRWSAPGPASRLLVGDELILRAAADRAEALAAEGLVASLAPCATLPEPLQAVELVLGGASPLVAQSLRQANFADRTGLNILAIRRGGKALAERTSQADLVTGDALLAVGLPSRIAQLAESMSHVLMTSPSKPAGSSAKTAAASVILLLMLAALTLNLASPAIVVLVAALAMAAAKCVRPASVYRSVSWPSLVLIACMLPLATAMKNSGGLDAVVGAMSGAVGDAGPMAAMAAVFLLAAGLSQVMSNTATAVLLAPVAISLAQSLDVRPEGMVMAVAVAASSSFSTPVSSPVNLLVLNAGQYSFRDFLRMGLPVQAAVFVTAMAVIPLLFPF